MNRNVARMKADGIDPCRIKDACGHISSYLAKEGFCLLEAEYVLASMGLVLTDMVKDDPLRKMQQFDYSASVEDAFSSEAASCASGDGCMENSGISFSPAWISKANVALGNVPESQMEIAKKMQLDLENHLEKLVKKQKSKLFRVIAARLKAQQGHHLRLMWQTDR